LSSCDIRQLAVVPSPRAAKEYNVRTTAEAAAIVRRLSVKHNVARASPRCKCVVFRRGRSKRDGCRAKTRGAPGFYLPTCSGRCRGALIRSRIPGRQRRSKRSEVGKFPRNKCRIFFTQPPKSMDAKTDSLCAVSYSLNVKRRSLRQNPLLGAFSASPNESPSSAMR